MCTNNFIVIKFLLLCVRKHVVSHLIRVCSSVCVCARTMRLWGTLVFVFVLAVADDAVALFQHILMESFRCFAIFSSRCCLSIATISCNLLENELITREWE